MYFFSTKPEIILVPENPFFSCGRIPHSFVAQTEIMGQNVNSNTINKECQLRDEKT